MIRISDLIAHNIGPFKSVHFRFPRKKIEDRAEIQLLTGENGTGKTTALRMLGAIVAQGDIYRRFRTKDASSNFEVKFDGGHNIKLIYDKTIGVVVGQSTQSSPIEQYNRIISKGGYDNIDEFDFAIFAYSGYRKLENGQINSIKEIETSPFHEALSFENSGKPSQLIDWIANQKTKEALAGMRNDRINSQKYSLAIKRIEEAVERITGEKIEFQLLDNPLKVVLNTAKGPLEFDLLPDGLKSIISWISDLLMRLDRIKWKNDTPVFERNLILFLDEIDVHLHPAWQRKIMPVVQELFKNAQIFITTHSPFVVGSTDGMWVHKLVSDGQNSTALPAVISENSKSYQLILDEIFNIPNFFGLEIEEKLKAFRKTRDSLLKKEVLTNEEMQKFGELIEFFKDENSVELDSIVGSELKQLKRILGDNFLAHAAV